MISKQYQFRSDPELEAGLSLVWKKNLNTSDNLKHIIRAGISVLVKTRGVKGVNNA